MKEPSPMPEAVIDAIFKWGTKHKSCPCWDDVPGADPCRAELTDVRMAHDALRDVWWAGDHYAFGRFGLYIGIETDGYMHT